MDVLRKAQLTNAKTKKAGYVTALFSNSGKRHHVVGINSTHTADYLQVLQAVVEECGDLQACTFLKLQHPKFHHQSCRKYILETLVLETPTLKLTVLENLPIVKASI